MIAVRDLTKHYGQQMAVDRVSFEVKEGENLVILGTSGCGKTTTLKMINKLIIPDSGKIKVNGTDINCLQPEELRRGIGFVLQHNSLFPHYTVEQNIAVVPRLLKWDRNRIRERTEALLEMVHLPGGKFLHKYPGQLSGGQQQRVNLARALAADPPILLMDEPFGALDAITRASISKDFSGIQEFMRKTVIMVTHDIQEAFMIGDHICLMSKGRIVQMGKPEELLFNPANDFVRDFFAASYLRLALGLIKIKDVWGELEGIQAEPSIIFEADVSLWSAMEMTVRNNELTTIDILNTEGQSKSVTKATLFSAFSGVTVSNAGI